MTHAVRNLQRLAVMATIAGAIALTIPVQAAAAETAVSASAQAQSNLVSIVFCNQSALRAAAAVSYVEVGDSAFTTRGWVILEPGDCRTMGQTPNPIFYAYAETFDGSNIAWQGNHSLCVQWPASFVLRVEPRTCSPTERAKLFVPVQSEAMAEKIWNLAPIPAP
jgi:uncharacterized membrane protein